MPAAILDKSDAEAGPPSTTSSRLAQYGPFMKLLAMDPLWDTKREDAIELINQWCDATGTLYPVVTRQKMLETADDVFRALDNAHNEGAKVNRGSLVEALFTDETNKMKIVMAIGRTVESGGRNDQAQRLFQSTTEAVEGLLWNTNTIHGIQLLALAAMYYYHLDEEVRTGRIIGFAARLCLEMGLHRRATVESTFSNLEERSTALRTFWSVYLLERRTSLGQGVPFSIQDSYVDPTLFTLFDFGPVVSALLEWTKLAGRTWHALNSQGEKEAEINMDELNLLDFQVTQWYEQLPGDLKLCRASLQQVEGAPETTYFQAVLFLRRSHLHNLIYRPVLRSAARIAQHERYAYVATNFAKEALQTLSDLNETTSIIRTYPLFFKHLLLTAFGNLLLAVVNAGSKFSDIVRAEFDIALDLIKLLSTRSGPLVQMWKRLQGLRKLQARLFNRSSVEVSSANDSSHMDYASGALMFDELFPALPLSLASSGGAGPQGDFAGGPLASNIQYNIPVTVLAFSQSLPTMSAFPLTGFDGYTSKSFTFKSTVEGDVSADVVYPKETDGSPSTVLIHYHGGFLIVGDRYSFLPYWLVHACASRKWIFVTPEYRLIPETTAHAALEDAVDAYEWVRSSLPNLLGRPIGSVILGGSSAGGYLALSTASAVAEKPAALFSIYGMLDPAGSRYTTPGPNIFGRPAIETAPVLQEFPKRKENEDRKVISAYPLPSDPSEDRRLALASALHIDALFPDYITGVDGLSRAIADRGVEAIPEEHHRIFPLSTGNLANIPRTMLLHGVNDSAVPVECSVQAEKKLRAAGSEVLAEFLEDAEHGFDVQIGNVNVEGPDGDGIPAVESLRNVIRFLDSSVAN
ncbi:hypothetical protein ACJ41O_006304 [Fusarium nematophilum]